MATARLIDSQKQELVRRFREGESTQALADHFGCSPTTVTRLVRAELGDEAYAALREARQKKGGRERQIPLAIAADAPSLSAGSEALGDREVGGMEMDPAAAAEDVVGPLEPSGGEKTTLALDDADDFGEDDGEDDLLSADDEDDDEDEVTRDAGDFHTVPVLAISVDDQRDVQAAPWSPALLPSSAYLLVDKTVELQARPLAEMPELGRLHSDEQERQALVLFTNPRQAKRQCGRTQRVIKLPDPGLLGRTAPYLLAQGISRVVVEGALYALPDQ